MITLINVFSAAMVISLGIGLLLIFFKNKVVRFIAETCCVTGIVFLCAIIVCAVVAYGQSTTDKRINTISQQENLSLDEKAEQIIQLATESFDNGDYIKAVNICDKVMSEYPDTECSKNMTKYLNEQYSKFNSISASVLMSEYTENVVNADKEYTNQILIIDGVVSSIDKTNNGSNLCVILESGAYFSGVQLNFNKKQEDAVSKLRAGDKIKAIGKCTGKSGKQFVVFDGNNVMIEKCYVIK